ncbi:MAG: two-component system regulatory protein YycI [Clostridia bacterium]|nr:two-component system regulatory protein YycI [Clostridia bacterium]
MDWSKAKSVLIVVFLILNAFLSVYLISLYQGNSVHRKNIINAVKILEDKGIKVMCKIPETRDSYSINYENSVLDKNMIASVLFGSNMISGAIINGQEMQRGSKRILFTDNSSFLYTDAKLVQNTQIFEKEKIVKICSKLLADLKLPVSDFYLDSYVTQPDGSVNLIFIEKVENYIIFSNRFEMSFYNGEIIRLKAAVAKINKGQKIKIKNIVPAYQILLRNYIGESNIIVNGIDLGYDCRYLEEGTSSTTSPIWRVRTGDGKERYFRAVDGQE